MIESKLFRSRRYLPLVVNAICAIFLATTVIASVAYAQAPAATPRKRREPPPPVIPMEETSAAQKQYQAGKYDAAVTQAKAALTKNEKFTPAMLVMAKAYYKLQKFEWVRTLWEMMQAAGASEAEKAELFQLLAFMERDKQNGPGAIELLKKATDARPENAIMWNNLGAQYLEAKNYRDATPVLEKAVSLQPSFAKAHLNLGSAYRGSKEYEKALASYQKALQLFPSYADAVFNMGVLYLDADKMPSNDTIAKLNAAIGHFQRYKQMIQSAGMSLAADPADTYISEAQDKITKEQKRIERVKQQEEREKQRATQKAAAPAAPAKPPAK